MQRLHHVIKYSNITSRDEITLYSICKLPIWELEIVDNAFYFMKRVLFIQICVKSVTSTGYSKNKLVCYKYSELMS